MSPIDGDPRAYWTLDADGLPVACGVDGEGHVWLLVHGTVARLDITTALKLGGRLNGAGQRATKVPRRSGSGS